MLIGLAGTHCTGKTTLAQELAKRYEGVTFLQTSTSAVFKRLGKDPKQAMPLHERLDVQVEVAKTLWAEWADAAESDGTFVTDRTPADMMAYLFAEVSGYGVIEPELDDRLLRYKALCQNMMSAFGLVYLVRIGIPFGQAGDKVRASGSLAYRTHHEMLIRAMLCEVGDPSAYRELAVTDLDERVHRIGNFLELMLRR